MIYIAIGFVFLHIIFLLILYRYLRYTLSQFLLLFFIGILTAVIVKIGLYGIGKELQIDFYFFEIKII